MNRTLASLALVVSLSAFASANLIVNGGFEDLRVSGNFRVFAVGDTSINGWTINGSAGQNVAVLRAGYLGQPTKQLDLSGTSDTPGSGISQTIATTIGGTYLLSFEAFTGGTTNTGQFDVFVGGNLVFNDVSSASPSPSPLSTTFIATGTSTAISFVNVGGNVSQIDNVSVTAVPEPASMAVLGLGLAALKRRRSVKK